MKQIKLLVVVMLCCVALTGCSAQREHEISNEIAALLNGETALAEPDIPEAELPDDEEEQGDDSIQPDEPEDQLESIPPIQPEHQIESVPQIEPEDTPRQPDAAEDEQLNQTVADAHHSSDDSVDSDDQPSDALPTVELELPNDDTPPDETTAPTDLAAQPDLAAEPDLAAPSVESTPLPNESENGPIPTTAPTPTAPACSPEGETIDEAGVVHFMDES